MKPLAGLWLGGSTLTEVDEVGGLGRPVWAPARLLGDLELRLGLGTPPVAEAIRAQAYEQRLAAQLGDDPFYRRSFEVDPRGAATTLLRWRDQLVMAGWNGAAVPGAGARVDALAAVEKVAEPALPAGEADRLVAVEAMLPEWPGPIYEALVLAEAPELWPSRWRAVFALLERGGTRLERLVSDPPATGHRPDTDLGRLQARLEGTASGPARIDGDGSLVLLRAETAIEASNATGALVAALIGERTADHLAVVVSGEATLLDHALARHGVPTLGSTSQSDWRPVLQVLPLVLELLFEPKDPYRVLELLTLPISPFHRETREELSEAMADRPGIGGPAWIDAKDEIASRITTSSDAAADPAKASERLAKQLARIESWLERPGHDPRKGAPRDAVLETTARVRDWLRGRLHAAEKADPAPGADEASVDILAAAYRQADLLHHVIAVEDTRSHYDLVALRLLVDHIAVGAPVELTPELAGRPAHVDDPAALLRPRPTIVWWHFVGGTEHGAHRLPWRAAEMSALAAAGLTFPAPSALLETETEAWRRVVRLAGERLVLVAPGNSTGDALEPHPFWSEITARLGGKDASAVAARLTTDTHTVLANGALGKVLLPTETLEPLRLPSARAAWTVPPDSLARDRLSPSSIETLLGCPLRFTFEKLARLRSGALASIPDGVLLQGKLAHRLVELLHQDRRFGTAAEDFRRHVGQTFEALLPQEGAPLLRAGASFDLAQFRRLVEESMIALDRHLADAGLTIQAVETSEEMSWNGITLEGHIDVLLTDAAGKEVVLDLKWGAKSYRERLQEGRSVQLAIYAALRKKATGTRQMPPTAYFSIYQGNILTTEKAPFKVRPIQGASASETWTRTERTTVAVTKLLATGTVPATGLRSSATLAGSLGLSSADQEKHLLMADKLAEVKEQTCKYCACQALCGQQWEVLQ